MELSTHDIERIAKIPMNFVVGKERSGTTLLQIMLNAHPNIVAPPESRFIILLYPRYGHIKQWTEKNITDFCNDLIKEGLFSNRWNLHKDELVAALIPLKQQLSYPLLCKIIYFLFAQEGKDVKVIFDKNPIYYFFLPRLNKIFPEAKFIHILRDYRDNIASYNRVFDKKGAAEIAYGWTEINRIIENDKLQHQGQYHTLNYEALVTDSESSAKHICTFLDLPYNDNMAKKHTENIYESFTQNKDDRFREFHGSLFQPVNEEHIGQWKQKLTAEQVGQAEAMAGEYGERYGYKKTVEKTEKINPLQNGWISLKFRILKDLYHIILQRLGLYYFVKRNIWPDF